MFIVTLLLVIVTIVLIVAALGSRFGPQRDRYDVEGRGRPVRVIGGRPWTSPGLLAAGALLTGVLAVLSLAVVVIPAGHVGVVRTFGRVNPGELYPGLSVVVPFANTVELVDTRVLGHHFENIEAASREYQAVILTGTVNTHVNADTASELVQNVGQDYEEKILVPAFSDIVKEIVPDYAIGDVLAKREDIRRRTKDLLGQNLLRYGITIDDIYLANIAFSTEYVKAVEEKQVAQQRVLTEQQILAQRQIQAQQVVVVAKGDADATVERARGQSEANRQLNASLTDRVIQYAFVQRLSDKITVALLPAGQGIILDTRGLIQPGATPAP
jgi:regulator of protease activity HflC (stomatin/prohibitin superfamily)